MAYIIDSFIVTIAAVAIVGIFIALVLLADESIDGSEDSLLIAGSIVVVVLALLVINWLYEALMTSSPRGATLGKRALGCASYGPTAHSSRSAARPPAIS